MRLIDKHKNFIYALVIIVLCFFVARNDSRSLLNILFLNVLTPVQEKVTDGGSWLVGRKDYYFNLAHIYQENNRLKKEVEELQAANYSTVEVWAENKRLRELLAYREENRQFTLITAKVIGRAPGRIKNEFIINRGRVDGIKENMPVVTADGLIGSIAMLYDNSAKVNLISHPQSSVGGLVQRVASRAVGIVGGEVIDGQYLKVSKLSRDADVIVGDKIITSGFGGIYPKGLLIGEVLKVENADGGLLKYAIIKPSVNYDKLEEVMIITNVNTLPEVVGNNLLNKPIGEKK
ncbi:rod shape-determining protein MreC [Succinispira mobilis]|uniref:rod shape-determining protein MreC n=1 Tax=Succinispira mobilis TaxID=78120 RepID=UPI000360CA0A|nr:rod shape-determining protein MreC [Succinispira mobilis]